MSDDELSAFIQQECARLDIAHECRWIETHVRTVQAASPDGLARDILARRARGEPLAYIFGSWAFRDFEFFVGPGALIPRPETEELVEIAIERARDALVARERTRPYRIVDAGAGSGCIGLSLAYDLLRRSGKPGETAVIELTLIERSPEANGHLRRNVALFQSEAQFRAYFGARGEAVARTLRIDVIESDWNSAFETIEGPIDLLVSNPPYLNETEWREQTEPSVREFEPRAALVPERDLDGAMSPYFELLSAARALSVPLAVFEMGSLQADRFDEIEAGGEPGLRSELITDMSGKRRFGVFTRISQEKS